MIIKPNIPISADFHVDNSRPETLEALRFFVGCCREGGYASLGAILGDLFHRREVVQVDAGNRVKDILSTNCVGTATLFGIPGNHDFVSDTPEAKHALSLLDGHGMVVLNRPFYLLPVEVEVGGGDNEKFLLAFMPFEPDPKKVEQNLKEILKVHDPKRTVLFGHQPLKGAEVRGQVLDSKFEAVSLYSKFRRVYFGDIHDRQKVGAVQYVGAPLEHDFGDAGKPRGFLIYNILQDTEEWVSIPSMPVHTNVDYVPGKLDFDANHGVLSWLEDSSNVGRTLHLTPGISHRIKLRPHGTDSEISLAGPDTDKLVAKLREAGAKVIVEPQPIIETPQRLEIEPQKLADLQEVFSAYVAQSDTTLDKTALIDLGSKLLPQQEVEDSSLEAITFQDMTLENFGSWKYCRFSFSQGLNSVIGSNKDEGGSNGSGKSALLNAIRMALFGDTQQEINADDHINWAAESYQVRLRFSASQGNYEVVRRRYRGKTSEAELKLNGTEIYNKVPQVNAELVRLLRMPASVFDHVVFMSQEGYYSFADETDGDQRSLLTAVLPGLDSVDAALTKAKDTRKSGESVLKAQQDSLVAARASHTTVTATNYEADITAFDLAKEQKTAEWEQKAASYAQQILSLEQADVPQLPQAPDLSGEEQELVSALAQESELNNLESQWTSYRQTVYGKKSVALATLKRAEAELAKIAATPTNVECDRCGQIISAESVAKQAQRWEVERNTAQTQLAAREQEEATAADALHKIQSAKANLQKFRDRRAELERIKAAYSTQVADVQAQIYKVKRDIEFLRESQNAALQNAKTERERNNPYITLQEQKKQKLTELEAEIRELSARVERSNSGLTYVDWLISAFGPKGIRVFLFDQFIATLATHINSFIGELFDGVYVTISTTKALQTGAVREKLDIQIWRAGQRLPMGRFSGGEQRLIRLAVNLSVAIAAQERLRTSVGLLVLDEAFENLDSFRVERVGSALEKLTSKIPMIYMVAHNLNLQNHSSNTILVRKENGVSYLGAA